jgi:CDP-6-deoxy-D-xylo-4-hexulose-3-dehydrase
MEKIMKYSLATETWSEEEKIAAKKVIDSGFCTMGKITLEFEAKFAEKFGSKYAVFSNSGSSANLLAIAALCFKKESPLKPGDEVIVPAISWSTTYYPLYQYGLKLKFVDVNLYDFNMSLEQVRSAITDKTKAIFAVNLLGMPCDLEELREICKEKNIYLVEDNCESMGATYNGKQCGTFGVMGTFSSFFSHHMCTIEGGITVTDDEELYQIMLSLRAHGWIRNLPDKNHICNKTGNFIEDTFKFVLPGYNLRPNEVFAAIGLEQLKKIDKFIQIRRENYDYLKSRIPEISSICYNFQSTNKHSKNSSWFGFGFLTKDRKKLSDYLIKNNIECRPIVAGDFTKNPVIKYMNYEIPFSLDNAKVIDQDGIFIGNNGENIKAQIDHFIEVVRRFE